MPAEWPGFRRTHKIRTGMGAEEINQRTPKLRDRRPSLETKLRLFVLRERQQIWTVDLRGSLFLPRFKKDRNILFHIHKQHGPGVGDSRVIVKKIILAIVRSLGQVTIGEKQDVAGLDLLGKLRPAARELVGTAQIVGPSMRKCFPRRRPKKK